MNYKLEGKARWIYKFKFLNKQRLFIFRITMLLLVLFIISIILIISLSIDNIYYVFPSIILPIAMIYPHAINRRRLQQLYVDLPKEIKPEYESFVNRYAKHLLLIQFVFKRPFEYDEKKIIELIERYQDKN